MAKKHSNDDSQFDMFGEYISVKAIPKIQVVRRSEYKCWKTMWKNVYMFITNDLKFVYKGIAFNLTTLNNQIIEWEMLVNEINNYDRIGDVYFIRKPNSFDIEVKYISLLVEPKDLEDFLTFE